MFLSYFFIRNYFLLVSYVRLFDYILYDNILIIDLEYRIINFIGLLEDRCQVNIPKNRMQYFIVFISIVFLEN